MILKQVVCSFISMFLCYLQLWSEALYIAVRSHMDKYHV